MADRTDLTTIGGRIEYVIRECRYPTQAAFARAIGTTPQNVGKWINTDSIGKFGAALRAKTEVNLNWLLTGDGDPFPEGPKMYADSDAMGGQRPADKAIHQLENDVDSIRFLLNALVAVLVTYRPGEAAQVAKLIRAKVPEKFVKNGYLKSVLGALDAGSEKAKSRHA